MSINQTNFKIQSYWRDLISESLKSNTEAVRHSPFYVYLPSAIWPVPHVQEQPAPIHQATLKIMADSVECERAAIFEDNNNDFIY